MMMEVEIISKETIKPSSPTPNHLKNFKLSLLDQLAPPSYEPLLLFYHQPRRRRGHHHHHHISVSKLSLQLKQSLSETLTRFYPLAGRVKDNITIDCSDYGGVYVQARVNGLLQDFLKQQPNGGDSVKQFIPVIVEPGESESGSSSGSLLLVQSSFFACGGVAIGVCISHKIADATTVSTFIKSWAAASKLDNQELPLYNASTLFPPRDASAMLLTPVYNFTKERCVTKRLLFDGRKIDALKATSASTSVQQPTGAEAVTGLIWKCAMNATRANSGVPKLSVLSQSVNIRKITEPPLPNNSVGNLVGYFAAQKDESDIQLQGLVRELRKGIQDFSKSYVNGFQREDAVEAITDAYKDTISMLISNDIDLYICTSLCNNVSVYDIDFGWGKPAWVTNISNPNHKNDVGLIDSSKGDGSIEATVTLSEADMTLFERDPEMLAYAAFNPSFFISSL